MASTRIPDLIIKKKNGEALSDQEIQTFITKLVAGEVQECQIGAMLMAICLKDMNIEEVRSLTRYMTSSGDTFSGFWPKEWKGLLVDKHSTGGVGDKVSLPLAPCLAACGLKVPMVSGRGLGFTGGTLDKLESIPGLRVSMSMEEIRTILENVGCCIVGASQNLCPADKKLYAIRDVTGTVDHIGLITGSILSKKAAEDLHTLVMDVKTGKGAVMQEYEASVKLAKTLVDTGNGLGIKTSALVTDMNSPLGKMVGNSLEVMESIHCLHGNGPDDLMEVVFQLGARVLVSCGKASSVDEGCKEMERQVKSGAALDKFREMIKGQGVNPEVAKKLCEKGADLFSLLPKAAHTTELCVEQDGYIKGIDAMPCALAVQRLGGGRSRAGDTINYGVGLELLAHIGDPVKKGSPWIRVHHDTDVLADDLRSDLMNALEVVADAPTMPQKRVLRSIP